MYKTKNKVVENTIRGNDKKHIQYEKIKQLNTQQEEIHA